MSSRLSVAWKWPKRHWRPIVGVCAAIVLVEVLIQLFYPHDHTLPLASIDKKAVGFQTTDQLTQKFNDSFSHTNLALTTPKKTVTKPLAELGADADADGMAAQATQYSLIYRLLPFSLLWYHPEPQTYMLDYNSDHLNDIADELAEKLSYKPTDANLTITDEGEVQVAKAKNGVVVDGDKLASQLQSATVPIGDATTKLSVVTTAKTPQVSDTDVKAVEKSAHTALDQHLTIKLDDKHSVTPTAKDIAGWLKVAKDEKGSPTLAADEEGISTYIAGISKQVEVSPTKTVVMMTDGIETARQPGKTGTGVDNAALTDLLDDFVTKPATGQQTITAKLTSIASPIEKRSSYTSSQRGLQAYVTDTASSTIKISVRQLSGSSWSASGGAGDSFVSASTYKPYVMLRMFDDINSGAVSWNDTIAGISHSKCLQDTIVVSANTCAEALISKYGRSDLTNYIHGKGFSGTGFTFSDAAHTTAADLTKLMAGIESGSLVDGDNRTTLLGDMGRQVYRQGIQAGTSAPVYDKVGFLWDYLNDAAIVRHPRGTYVVAILTKGESWARIASITKQLEQIMYP